VDGYSRSALEGMMPHDETVVASLTEALSNTLRSMTGAGEGLLARRTDEIWLPTKTALEAGHCPGLASELTAMMAPAAPPPPVQPETAAVAAVVVADGAEVEAAGSPVVVATVSVRRHLMPSLAPPYGLHTVY
jgi:hypothetical protein